MVGYVRESPSPQDADTAYAQAEKVRRAVAEGGHQLVAVCQDLRQPGSALNRDGYQALVGIVDAGQVDGVLIASLQTLSPDKIVQEIMMWDLRSRRVKVLSAEPDDVPALSDPPLDRSRQLVRDVLARVGQYLDAVAHGTGRPLPISEAPPEVPVEIIPAQTKAGRRRRSR